jgi:hypothetical protein
MLRQPVGVVKFRDIRLNTRAQISISRIPRNNTTHLFLDLDDPEVGGVLGAGDLEVGLDRENIKRLLAVVQQAISNPITRDHSWEAIGGAEFSWSDHTEEETGEDYGTILIESNGPAVRMVFRTKKWDWEPYVATFSLSILNEVSTLLSQALSES